MGIEVTEREGRSLAALIVSSAPPWFYHDVDDVQELVSRLRGADWRETVIKAGELAGYWQCACGRMHANGSKCWRLESEPEIVDEPGGKPRCVRCGADGKAGAHCGKSPSGEHRWALRRS